MISHLYLFIGVSYTFSQQKHCSPGLLLLFPLLVPIGPVLKQADLPIMIQEKKKCSLNIYVLYLEKPRMWGMCLFHRKVEMQKCFLSHQQQWGMSNSKNCSKVLFATAENLQPRILKEVSEGLPGPQTAVICKIYWKSQEATKKVLTFHCWLNRGHRDFWGQPWFTLLQVVPAQLVQHTRCHAAPKPGRDMPAASDREPTLKNGAAMTWISHVQLPWNWPQTKSWLSRYERWVSH